MKLAHLADTHIKNLKYHYEYREVFKRLYESLREESVDYIIHCGDIAHTKTQISPEFVEMCSDFFRNLAAIAPTYIILGNHDGNLKNSNRQDAITPIVDALQHPNLFLLKNSGEVALEGDVTLNVLSVFDEEGWVKPSDPDRINIALYHGSISGVMTDSGWVMTHGEHPIEIFEGHDYGFLGDIHKTDQRLDEEGKIRYCGSTIQQNHGESNDKGFLLWDIQGKEDFTCKHIELKNPKPFFTVYLTPAGKIPRGTKVPMECRLRLVSNNNLPLDVMRKAIDVAKQRFHPESISFLNRASGQRGSVEGLTSELEVEDLRNIKVQESLIKEYLKDYEVQPPLMKRVLGLNEKYNKIAEDNEEVSRNVNWRLRSLEFDNLFNYGEKNKINFDNLEGIVGIFGKNYSGKSSVIDSLLYTIYNSTSKNDRKTLNVINQNKDNCFSKVKISVGDNDYTIERNSEKYIRTLKGKTTTEAKTHTNFEVKDAVEEDIESLNGLTRIATDKNIRKIFGTLDDFMYSSMASQLDSLSFIKEGSTKRKEILAKFLDLQFFESKFKLAKEDITDTKGALKKLEDRDFNSEIEEAQLALADAEGEQAITQAAQATSKNNIAEVDAQIQEIKERISSIPADIIDVVKVRAELRKQQYEIVALNDTNAELSRKKETDQGDYVKITSFLDSFDKEALYQRREEVERLTQTISSTNLTLEQERTDLATHQSRVKLLEDIPCGSSFPKCKFIRDAYVSRANIPNTEKNILNLVNDLESLRGAVKDINPAKIQLQIEKYEEIVSRQNELTNNVTRYALEIEKNESLMANVANLVEKLEAKVDEYELNKDAIENLESLNINLTALSLRKTKLAAKVKKTEQSIFNLYKTVGSLEEKVKSLQIQRNEYNDLREEFSAFDLYMRCMHPNGIAFDIIRKKLPIINEEIAKILANIVDFEVFFEDDGRRLDIYIKHPLYDPRPLEMGSGAEKTLSAMAIRLALLSVSSLPKSDIFILDEPGTSLDEENMQGFVDILSIIKSYFKTVLLISHLESLKDCVDMQVTIDKKNGYASVNA